MLRANSQYPAKGARAEQAEKKKGGKPDGWISQLPDNKQNELFEEYYRVCYRTHRWYVADFRLKTS